MSGAPQWSAADTATLRRLYCVEGRPISHIRKTMGRTDWAIRGKIGYERWPTPGGSRQAALNRGAAGRIASLALLPQALPGDKRVLRSGAWAPLPGTSPVSLVDLEPGMCKWPIGHDKPYLFCGAACEGSYCSHHRNLSVQP